MSTNYYARIKPSADEKQKLINAINNDESNIIVNISQELYGKRDADNEHGHIIHLGNRACGWKFLWNHNIIRVWNSQIGDYQWEHFYPLTKQGIIDFVMREDVEISDEYGKVLSAEEFLDMSFNWCVDGLDNKEYYTNPKHGAPHYYDSYFNDDQLLLVDLGYNIKYHEFYSDGLRFSSTVNFS